MTEKKLELIKCNYLDFDSFLEGVWVINFKFNIPGSSYIQLIDRKSYYFGTPCTTSVS